APARGFIPQTLLRFSMTRRIAGDNLLRAAYEYLEAKKGKIAAGESIALKEIADLRQMGRLKLWRLVRRLERKELVFSFGDDDNISLTPLGFSRARQLVRKHRLWEQYLVSYGEVPPSHV